MSKTLKPIVVIVVAVAVAASAAVYLSRENKDNTQSTAVQPLGDGALAGATTGRVRGKPDAPVTLLEFGDYQCPSCKAYHPVVSELVRRFPDKVKLEYRHYPLVQIHRNAMAASMAAEAAGEQGRYWEMHDLLFEYQDRWASSDNAETEFMVLASRLGLNSDRFMQSLRSPELQQRILQNVTEARAAGVEGTPSFFVNGQPIGLPNGLEEFVQVLDDHLRTTQ